jgi:hypothetical protein
MSYVYYNPNPRHKKSVGDCTVRALSKALAIPWETAFIDLVSEAYELGDMPSSNAVMQAYLRRRGFRKHIIDDLCPDCYSISDFANEHFRGTYIVGTGTHVVAVVDGDYFDSWDSGDEIPLFYYEREDWT